MSQPTQTTPTGQFKDLPLHQQNNPKQPSLMNLDKNQESKKGYWTDDESRGISLVVTHSTNNEAGSKISLSSEYWYRVQHFDLPECQVAKAWQVILDVAKACGRTLVPHTIEENDADANELEEGEVAEPTIEYYRISYLNPKQTDQLYYFLKHSLTTMGTPFVISHTFTFDTTNCVPAPGNGNGNGNALARRKRRKSRAAKKIIKKVN